MHEITEQSNIALPPAFSETPGIIRRNIPTFIAAGLATIAFSEAAPQSTYNSAYAQDSCTVETSGGGTGSCEASGGSSEPASGEEQTPPESKTPEQSAPGKSDKEQEDDPHKMSRRELARGILVLIREGRIVQQKLKYGKHDSDKRNNATPIQNLKSIAAGNKAHASDHRCAHSPKQVNISKKLLQFMYELGNETRYGITTIAGGCHSPGSKHYSGGVGKAVDIGCEAVPFTAKKVRVARKIGRPLGITNNFENCRQHSHYHFYAKR